MQNIIVVLSKDLHSFRIDEMEHVKRYRWLKKELERRGDKPFYFFRHLIPEEQSRKLWIEIKS